MEIVSPEELYEVHDNLTYLQRSIFYSYLDDIARKKTSKTRRANIR